ncbi:glycosyltransferase family 2 protein [Bacteroides hominis]|jgi:glycosyltransferase involved in cell wall biosynthesis|uniref:glycosyltransferase family 2 protein n=1 Tax=Bacteroides hominis TaxID=2763023 RepID=UPI0029496B2F|nr:glycosyltransferase family 2 protein [Bacteroides hominis (ex Liu et al. 2022)]MDV6173742.1 glycosyltransferase family 2 protein [Bacteroides hominis (ex Liu et al. 2022)]
MDLSIIIPIYNAAPLLNRCIESIFNQKTNYSYEVIFIDDGSSDNSIEIIKKRKEKNIILYQQANSGPAAARNKGIELAKGKYCTFIDADDYWNNGYIEQTVQFLNEHQECVAVSVACQNFTSFSKNPSYNPSWMDNTMHETPFVINDFFEYWANYCHVGTCSTTMCTNKVRETGGMRLDLRVTEDYEFWAYLSTFGQWGVIPSILYVSDGNDVTAKQGWVKKMEKRWNNAPSIAEWEKRIIQRLPLKLPISFLKARGCVSRNLTYCQLLSGRLKLSRHEALKYGIFFIQDPIGKLMNIAKYTTLTWWILAKWLQHREYHRKLK